jgi:cold shock CspA family protein
MDNMSIGDFGGINTSTIWYGTLKHWVVEGNYGFVRDDSSGKDLFIHVSSFIDKVGAPPGSRLKYHIAPNPKKAHRFMAVDAEIVRPRIIAAQYSDQSEVL